MSLALSNVAYRIQYIPGVETPQPDQNLPTAPTDLFATPGIGKVVLSTTVGILADGTGDMFEWYAASVNDRTTATRITSGILDTLNVPMSGGATKYFWVRVRRPVDGVDSFSAFYPTSPTGGVSGTPSAAGTTDIAFDAATETYSTTDAGPININLNAPSTSILFQQVKYVTITADDGYDYEITASFRLGVTGTTGFTVTTFPAMFDTSGTQVNASQGIDKTANVYEMQSCTGLLTRFAGTWRVGIGCSITNGDGVSNYTATFRDLNLRVAVIKR